LYLVSTVTRRAEEEENRYKDLIILKLMSQYGRA